MRVWRDVFLPARSPAHAILVEPGRQKARRVPKALGESQEECDAERKFSPLVLDAVTDGKEPGSAMQGELGDGSSVFGIYVNETRGTPRRENLNHVVGRLGGLKRKH
jgi:hypothetical protein